MSNTLKIPSSRNGDTRYDGTLYGGRTSSQQSIYDYPEHLNPFYEDENHKRIRFWNIVGCGKNKHKNGSTNSRRGSFSLTGLKEMWAFKSLRLSKKRSSNLGINKTSESPPPIRRITDNNYENHYGTYDPRMRHTVGNNMTTTINNNFLRNVPYRSSLQDMRSIHNIEYNNNNNSNNNNNNSMTTMTTTTTTNNGLGFERNNRYRNTIQTTQRRSGGGLSSSSSPKVPPRRYVYGGSMTPQPRLRSNDLDDDYSGISRGSSQISITSKNPFEEDDNDTDDVVVDKLTGSDEKRKRHIRKKRRAPPPPIPIPKIIYEEPQTNTSPDCCHDQQHNKTNDESLEIKNLADEIENFVKSTNNSPDKENLKNNYSREIDDTASQKDDHAVVRVTNENHQENSSESLKEEEKKTTFTIVTTFVDQDLSPIIKCDDNQKEIDSTETTEIQQENIESEKTIKETINENKISTLNSDVEKDTDIEISRIEDHDNLNLNDNEIQKIPEHPVVDELNNDDQKTIELKITESVEDLSERSQKSETSNEVVSEFEYVPLNISSNLEENEKQDEVEIKEINVNLNEKILYEDHTILRHDQNEEKDKETTATTTTTTTNTSNRRRSVREIIEAINRSQKLLNINNQQNVSENHDDNKDGCEQKSTIDSDTNVKNNNVVIKAPPRKKYDLIKDHQLKQQQNDNNNSTVIDDNSIQTEDNDNSYYDGGNNENDNNCVIFKKCEINNKKTINRETSPISSNLDWNPVPKPKRTKKLTIELQKCDDQNEMKSE